MATPEEALEEKVRSLLPEGRTVEAATEVISSLGPSVHGYLCALHGEDDGADVYSAWSEDVWRGLSGFRFEAPLRAWCFRVAWNASVRFRRDPWRARRLRLATSEASRLAASATRGAPPGPRDERLAKLRSDLDPEEHTLLVLRLDRDMSWEEIAVVLAETGGGPTAAATLRKRYQRLKRRLARRARQRGLLR